MAYPTRLAIEQLTPDERLRLIAYVWETFEAQPESLELSEAHCEPLDKRLSTYEKNPEATVSWEDALDRLRQAS